MDLLHHQGAIHSFVLQDLLQGFVEGFGEDVEESHLVRLGVVPLVPMEAISCCA